MDKRTSSEDKLRQMKEKYHALQQEYGWSLKRITPNDEKMLVSFWDWCARNHYYPKVYMRAAFQHFLDRVSPHYPLPNQLRSQNFAALYGQFAATYKQRLRGADDIPTLNETVLEELKNDLYKIQMVERAHGVTRVEAAVYSLCELSAFWLVGDPKLTKLVFSFKNARQFAKTQMQAELSRVFILINKNQELRIQVERFIERAYSGEVSI